MVGTLDRILAAYREPIEAALADAVVMSSGCPERLGEAIRYALLAPGKRLRPALTLMAAEACGGDANAALPAAVAVEMIHAYSLIHDDLPAMDDDDLRRNRPTTHIAFDEATAILAGDALQARAFGVLSRGTRDPEIACQLVRELAGAAGAEGLMGGQADDLAAETVSLEQAGGPAQALPWLESIHHRKTGALFAASVRMGGIAGGGKASQIDALTEFARHLGLAFQITDDILDLTADDAVMGKRVGKDHDRGKFTYPSLLAGDEPARRIPSEDSDPSGTLGGAAALSRASVALDDGIGRARDRAARLIASAHDALALFGPSAKRLHAVADFVMERTH